MVAVKRQMAEPAAAERLATARAGLERLGGELAAAQAQQAAAKADFDALDAQIADLYRRADVAGAGVADDLAAVKTLRADAAQRAQDAGLAANDLARRIASVRAALPAMERAVTEEELATVVAIGAERAAAYRAALQAMLSAAIELQSVLTRCAGLSDNISRDGRQPAHRLAAHLVESRDIDHVLFVARTGGPADVQQAISQLFERWRV